MGQEPDHGHQPVDGRRDHLPLVRVQQKPDLSYKKDGDTVKWTFDAAKIDTILGIY